MTRFLLVLVMMLAIAASVMGMQRAWRRRVAAQASLPVPTLVASTHVVAGPWHGRYLGATQAGRWLDRIDAHRLGERALVDVSVTDAGIDIIRTAAPSFTVPHRDVVAVRADKAIAGRAYEDGGIVVLTFRLGETPVDIGFRFPDTADHLAALSTIARHSEVAS